MEECIFCKISRKEIPAKIVFEDENIVAFEDIKPTAPVHVLIVPKKHIEMLAKASDDDALLLGQIQLAAAKVANKLGIESAFRLRTLNGKDAGQTVYHMHYHLTGGWKNQAPPITDVVEEK